MRCDLHVHTRYSGMCTVPLLRRICRESYSEPLDVYHVLKQRNMDLVTITDHDSIDAVESLRRYPDFFLSEEVSAVCPSGTKLHIGVYDINDRNHIQIERRRADLFELMAYLKEQRLFFTVNHIYSSLTGPRTEADYALFVRHFPGFEALNGQIPDLCNRRALELATRNIKAITGGSDAHTLAALGRTYTQVDYARTKQEFFDGLRSGQATLHGESGAYWKLTRAVWTLGSGMLRDNPWTTILSPLLVLVPLFTLMNVVREFAFVHRWASSTSIPDPAPLMDESARGSTLEMQAL